MGLSSPNENNYNSNMSNDFINKLLVELSDLDENKLNKIIAFKQSARKRRPNNPILSDKSAPINRVATFISEEGEKVARQIRQAQRRDFSEDDIAAIIAAYQSGKSANELAREYSCDRKTICAHLKKHGIEVSREKIKNEETSKEIIALYERGHTAAEIAKMTSISATTIQRHLNEQGIKLRGRWG